jgi:TDG/mug DNA glycosylase family protein
MKAKTRTLKPKPSADHVLPDLLRRRLDVVFCGTAAGTVSAQRGAYYAHPHNKFWPTLHKVKLTPRLLKPDEFPLLLDYGIGLTDIAKHVFGMDKELPPQSLGRLACRQLAERIEEFQPRILAFTSMTGGARFLGRSVTCGRQEALIGKTQIWVLPSPSPIAQWNWDDSWWKKLAKAVK